jgi:hypothetical protein
MQGGRSLDVADRIISAIMEKLRAHRSLIAQSSKWGRLAWRTRKDGEIEVDLEPKV